MDVIVKTKNGYLSGLQGDGFAQFLGIPYAKPPVGALRFRKPEPMEPWDGIRQAKRYGNYCCQPGKLSSLDPNVTESEDCLTLNIFTPACDDCRRPVAVWIHGGAYLTGCASEPSRFGGQMAINANIVVVSIQYRLGAFGQINFGSMSGANGLFDTNCGTWDQVAAVNWVTENIEAFGGDPDCITLMGESAGGSSVLTLMTTPYLKGRIRRAILESPAPFLIHTHENGRKAALQVLEQLGIPEKEAWKAAALPSDTLTQAVKGAQDRYADLQPFLIPTGPVVDGDLIPELPFDAVMNGAADGIEVLIGTTRDEGTMFARGKAGDLFPSSHNQLNLFWETHPRINSTAILELYAGIPHKKLFQEIGKEIVFHLPSAAIADQMAKKSNVYMYRFDYAYPVMRMLGLGAVHCTNSVLTFGGKRTGILKFYGLFTGKTGNNLAAQVHRRWCRFIAHGDPNGTPDLHWPVYGEKGATYVFDTRCAVEIAPSEKERKAYGIIRPFGN